MKAVSLADRVVEVIAEYAGSAHPRYRYGSGCVVAGGTVLTAAHVVTRAHSVYVRDPNKELHPATLEERFVGDASGLGPDLALLTIDSPASNLPAIPLARVDRDSAHADPVERCHAVGYPWFAERPSPDAVRETVDAFGYVAVLSKLTSGLLSLHVSGPPRPLPPGSEALVESEWSGMSGAPVVAAGCLLGVVTEHAAREGPGTMTFTPLTALEPDPTRPGWGPGVGDAASWWARLGVAGSAALKRLPPRPRVRPEPAYRATVREVQRRTRELRGRERELSETAAFATSSERYRWLVGGAWTGKTALLAAALGALPEEVDVVSYFLSRREADADSVRFLGATVPQLADLLDEDPPVADKHHFRALWERACAAAVVAERHLLLVVDGLDEDLEPSDSQSVASLLPTQTGGRAHVLVSSRPYPELPSDVPPEHPLRATPQTPLEPFEGAAEMAALARQEVDELKRRDDGLATDVLAILTAAAGPLAVTDLATLTADPATLCGDMRPQSPAHTRAVRHLVSEAAARSLQPVGATTDRRYQFAHASLLEYAQTDEDLTDPYYRERIHRWAEAWAARGWPAGEQSDATPRYLLDVYPATLAGDSKHSAMPEDRQRLVELVCDIGWVDAATALVGVDRVLSSLRTATQVIPDLALVGPILKMLEQRAQHLRNPRIANQPGYAATALAWQARAFGGLDQVVAAASNRLRALPAPQLIPVWTTERIDPSLVSVLGRHDGPVSALAVSGDGLVVSGDERGAVRLWDPRTPGDRGRELGRHDGAVGALAGMCEALVVSGGRDGAVRLLDPRTAGAAPRELGRHDGAVVAVAVTGDGLIVSGGSDGTVRLCNPRTRDDSGRELRHLESGDSVMALTSEGLVVSESSDGTLRLWDARSPGDLGRELGRYYRGASEVAVAGEGLVVSASSDGTLRAWDADSPGEESRPMGWQPGRVRAVVAGSDGLVVSGADDGLVLLWDPRSPGDGPRWLGRHGSSVGAVAVTAEGFIVSGGYDGTVKLWDPHTPRDPEREPSRDVGTIFALAVTGEGAVTSGGEDGAVRLWDPRTPTDGGRELGRHAYPVLGVAVSRDGLVVSGSQDRAVRLWDPGTPGDRGPEIGSHEGWVRAVAVTDEGLVVTGGEDGVVRLWDPRTPGAAPRELAFHEFEVLAVAETSEGMIVSGGSDDLVRLWDPRAPGDGRRDLGRHDGGVLALAATGQSLVVSGGVDGALRLWDTHSSGDSDRELGHHDGGVPAVAVTAEGLIVSGGADGAVRVWDRHNAGDPGRELARHDGGVNAMAVTADGHLSIATSGGITTFEITTSPL